jgi:hypothetical protein
MPDLIYNVKFEIDQASAEKVGQIVDTSNAQDIKLLQSELNRLKATIESLSSAQDQNTNSKNRSNNATKNEAKFINESIDRYKQLALENTSVKRSIDLKREAAKGDLQVVQETNVLAEQAIQSLKEQRANVDSLLQSEKLSATQKKELTSLNNTLLSQEKQLESAINSGTTAIQKSAKEAEKLVKEKEDIARATAREDKAVENVDNTLGEAIGSYKRTVSELKLLETELNKSLQVNGRFGDETLKVAQKLETKSEKVQEAGVELLRLSTSSDRTEEELTELYNTVSFGNRAMVTGAKRAREFTSAQSIMEGQMGDGIKTFSAGNQAIFSFSDLIQDSTQFSYGFATGMRAIGNNISFTAELLAYMSREAKAAGQTMRQSLMASLKGVNGVVLGLNFAVTVGTILLEKFGKKAKDASKDTDELKTQSELIVKAFSGFSNVLGKSTEQLLPMYSSRIQQNIEDLRIEEMLLKSQNTARLELNLSIFDTIKSQEKAAKEGKILDKNIQSLTESINKRKESSEVLNSVDEKTLEEINKRISAFEEERKVREAIRDLIAENITEAEKEAMVAAARASVPIDVPVDILIDDEIDPSLLDMDLDIGAPAGSLAFDLSVLSELQSDFQRATTEEERKAIAERIKLKQAEVNKKQELIKMSKDSEEKLAEDSNAITKTQLKAVAQTAATILPSLFEDQKASAIASALVNAGSAIIRQYSDLPLAAAIPASIATAAATQKQIQQIKNTKFGDTGGSVSGGGGGGTSAISPISSSSVSQPTQSITFLPNAATSGQAPPAIDVKIDRAGLAVAVGRGGREIGNKQVRV